MDDVVLRAMAKWPDVPAVFGWLALDRRGNWLIRNERIENPAMRAYINRNYHHDARGRWFFQNGPQRVFVALDYTPLVHRARASVRGTVALETHAGETIDAVDGVWLDEAGNVLIDSCGRLGVVHDQDLEALLPFFCGEEGADLDEDALSAAMARLGTCDDVPLRLRYGAALLPVRPISRNEVPERFGFVREPAPAQDEAACA